MYKYLLALFIISLFIFHQKTSLNVFKVLLFSIILTFFFMIMDFVFIGDHPNIFKDNDNDCDINEGDDKDYDELEIEDMERKRLRRMYAIENKNTYY